jgi:hypothetical protein
MKMICISSFDLRGKIKGISINRVYDVKYIHSGKLLITNDYGKPQMVICDNFVNYQNIKGFINQ